MLRIFLILISLFFIINNTFAEDSPPNSPGHITLNNQKIDLGNRLSHDPEIPIKNLATQPQQVINHIKKDPIYMRMFNDAYQGKITLENMKDALKQYQYSIEKPARFDDYLRGDKNAITAEELHGYQLFKSYGCAACHNGPDFGGKMYKKLGVAKNYFIERRTMITPTDLGLYEVTKNMNDIGVFKVPTLRNIAVIYPYYHDGSVKTLGEAVYLMGKYQVGVEIPPQDVQSIIAFLRTLTAKSLEEPQGNTSTTTTSKPSQ
jgi:cytochrome c peroxidase